MPQQHGVRISYGADPADHSTHVVYVPLDRGDFPKEFVNAVAKAGVMLLHSVSRDILPKCDLDNVPLPPCRLVPGVPLSPKSFRCRTCKRTTNGPCR